jgi:hypothetical protein
MAEPETGVDTVVELRLERVQHAVDMGFAKQEGAFAALTAQIEQVVKAADEHRAATERKFEQRDESVAREFERRDRVFDDHEARLRAVDGLPARVTDVEDVVEKDAKRIGKLETRQAMYAGAIAVGVSGVNWLVEWALFHR